MEAKRQQTLGRDRGDDAVDRRTLSRSDVVTVRHSDLTVFHEPIRPLVRADGYRTTVAAPLGGE